MFYCVVFAKTRVLVLRVRTMEAMEGAHMETAAGEIKTSSGSKRQVSVGNLISAGPWRLHSFGGSGGSQAPLHRDRRDGLVPNKDDVAGLQPPYHSVCRLGEPESLESHVLNSLDTRVF